MNLSDLVPIDIQLLVSILVVASILLGVVNSKVNSLKVGILNRWSRWLCISVGLAFLVDKMEWANRPFWALAVIFFLFWLLLETLYTWLAISAMSQSSISLFPRFRNNKSGEEWPAQKKLIQLRDWLRDNGFRKLQALVADIGNGIDIRSSIYQDKSGKVRAHVLFIPQPNGLINYSLSFTSETADGERLITDNMHTPYGGFYPDNWNVIRRPWTRSATSLFRLHERRIQSLDLEEYEVDPVDDLNQQQGVLERKNIEEGFLFPPHLQEENGRITWEGRYRVWKEVWLLNYFGIASRG